MLSKSYTLNSMYKMLFSKKKNMKNLLFAPSNLGDLQFIVRFSRGLTFPSALHTCPTSNAFKLSFETATFAGNNCMGLEIHTVHSDTSLD